MLSKRRRVTEGCHSSQPRLSGWITWWMRMISSRWRQSDTPSYEAMVELAREASVHPWGFTCSRCVSNLHKKQPDDHVKRIAQFSMDAIAAANSVIVDAARLEVWKSRGENVLHQMLARVGVSLQACRQNFTAWVILCCAVGDNT